MTTIMHYKMIVSLATLFAMVTVDAHREGGFVKISEDTVKATLKMLTAIKSKNNLLEETVKKLEGSQEKFNENNRVVSDIQHQLKSSVDFYRSDTLFLATLSIHQNSIESGETIIWDTAPINVGGHYSTTLGSYTAPYHGYYEFTVTKESNDNKATFHILVNGERYAYIGLKSADTDPSTSTTITIELTAGQTVSVENNESTIVYGTSSDGIISSWFTGYLLYAL